MRLEIENKEPIENVKEHQIRKYIKSLRSYGKHSFASLTDMHGNYVQVGGGGVTCMVEKFDAEKKLRLRAYHDKPSSIYPDGTLLSFGAGMIALRADEWFMADQVVEIMLCFFNETPYPSNVFWRNAPGF